MIENGQPLIRELAVEGQAGNGRRWSQPDAWNLW
jgi:hypothetical protein